MRVNRHGAVFSDNPRLKGWQQKAALAIAKAREGRPLEAGPVSLIAEFRFARPPSHYTKTGALRAGAPQAPGRPDLDKLLRALLDALTGVAFKDDAQIIDIDATKRYCDPPGVLVRVAPVSFEGLEDL
jgi:crossover junction endodeoxyribonuclease RusA